MKLHPLHIPKPPGARECWNWDGGFHNEGRFYCCDWPWPLINNLTEKFGRNQNSESGKIQGVPFGGINVEKIFFLMFFHLYSQVPWISEPFRDAVSAKDQQQLNSDYTGRL